MAFLFATATVFQLLLPPRVAATALIPVCVFAILLEFWFAQQMPDGK